MERGLETFRDKMNQRFFKVEWYLRGKDQSRKRVPCDDVC